MTLTPTTTLRSLLPPTERLGEIGLRLAITAIVALAILRLLFLIANRIERLIERTGGGGPSAQRARTLGGIMRSVTTFLIGAIACIHGLEILGWNVAPLLAGAGLVGVAVGFGAQSLVRDVIAGMFILAEDQFAVGDVIEVGGGPATVEDIAVRSTRLRDGNGYVHFVPNGEIRTVTNRSRGWNRAIADVVIAPDENADRALEICREVVTALNADQVWRERLLDPAEVWGIESLTDAGVSVRISARTRPGADSALAARELRRRLHGALLEAGIGWAPRRDLARPGERLPAIEPRN
jgi:small conductance mechanosensitive channel